MIKMILKLLDKKHIKNEYNLYYYLSVQQKFYDAREVLSTFYDLRNNCSYVCQTVTTYIIISMQLSDYVM